MAVGLHCVFPDLFLPNAAIGAAGFAAALFWLRTGMVRRGVLLLVTLAVASDVALVARFVFAERAAWFCSGLWVMQAAALGGAGWLAVALLRRRWAADAGRRDELFADGFRLYLRDEFAPAAARFVRILRVDPWDVAATVALANVRWRQGRIARARRLLQAARRLDRRGGWTDFVAEQARRVGAGPRATPAVQPTSPPAVASPASAGML